jgi:predicted kinase
LAVLYLFIGYPGAGKTTIAKYIEQHTGAVHLWADKERQKLFGYATHSAAENIKLYDYLDETTDKLLAEGKSVIFDTNFNYHKDRMMLKAIAEERGAETKVIWVNTPKEICKPRALHHTHRDRNGYQVTMTEQEFDRLANHLEPPTEDEKALTIDGSDLSKVNLKEVLAL